MTRRTSLTYATLVGLCAVMSLVALSVGSGDLADAELRDALLRLRAMRTAGAALAGAALAAGGVIVQGLFRNPLASPSILGTTAGATFGGKLALLGFEAIATESLATQLAPELVLPLGCVCGALLALAILLAVHQSGDDLVVLLLTGFLLSALFLSLGGFVTSLAQQRWELARALVVFALGDVSGVGLPRIALAVPLVLGGIGATFLWARPLDLMLSGEQEARTLGVDVPSVRRWCVIWTAVLTAAAVAIGGNVGFVGLIVPHALRPFVGVTHRQLLPAAALAGACFVVACDTVSRGLPTQTEIPLGVVTGLVGAPLFLRLLVRSRRQAAYG